MQSVAAAPAPPFLADLDCLGSADFVGTTCLFTNLLVGQLLPGPVFRAVYYLLAPSRYVYLTNNWLKSNTYLSTLGW